MTEMEETPEVNVCAQLTNRPEFTEAKAKYIELIRSGNDPFKFMLGMQRDLQFALSEKNPINPDPTNIKTLGEKFDWIREQKQSFDDEYRELVDALPGMNTPAKERSAIWKKWKSKYTEIRSRTFDDLSGDEIKELKFEFVDAFHFFMNMTFALDLTAEELFIYYYTKNAENFRRSKNGY